MKIVKLQVMYEKLFPDGHFSLAKYKESLEKGLIEKLSNQGYDDMSQLEFQIMRYSLVQKLIENNENASYVKYLTKEEIRREIDVRIAM